MALIAAALMTCHGRYDGISAAEQDRRGETDAEAVSPWRTPWPNPASPIRGAQVGTQAGPVEYAAKYATERGWLSACRFAGFRGFRSTGRGSRPGFRR